MGGPGERSRHSESRGGARFTAPVQTGSGAHTASYKIGTGSFLRVKRPGRGVDGHSHPRLLPRLKESVQL